MKKFVVLMIVALCGSASVAFAVGPDKQLDCGNIKAAIAARKAQLASQGVSSSLVRDAGAAPTVRDAK